LTCTTPYSAGGHRVDATPLDRSHAGPRNPFPTDPETALDLVSPPGRAIAPYYLSHGTRTGKLAGRADEYGRRYSAPGELLCRLRIEHLTGFADVAA
jgi:hypothetical protein